MPCVRLLAKMVLLSSQPHRWLERGTAGLGEANPAAEAEEPLASP